ncbi:MAG: FHA domain-containing protein [Candidatus Promineifilaceae bacterium]|nr:FHA domain-containing protein [Candidatus Promineifilaceae bacterium]
MILCRECGRTLITGSLFCSECGSYQLSESATALQARPAGAMEGHDDAEAPVDEPTKPPKLPSLLTVIIATSNREVSLSLKRAVRIGRHDPESEVDVDLDLTDDDGADWGVSRLHAAIARRPEGIFVVDLGSTNGTLVNNHMLKPKSPHRLHDGDEIRFGRLLVRIFFD